MTPRANKVADADDALIERNRSEDLYIVHARRIVYIPRGWCDAFDDPSHGGPSFIDQDTEEPSPELYGYGYVGESCTADGFDTIYWRVRDLRRGRLVTKDEAQRIDPALFEHLDKINRGEV